MLFAVPTLVPDQLVPYDGGQLRRYAGDGPPVLLVHGLGVNHLNFDFQPRVSLADALREEGWDVWVVELPGDDGEPVDADADAWAHVHLDAAMDVVLGATGADGLFAVGHSLGAMMLLAHLDDPRLRAAVAVSGAGQFEHTTRWVRMGRRLRSPGSGGSAAAVRSLAWTLPLNPALDVLGVRRNLDRRLTAGLVRHALVDSPPAVVRQVHGWTRGGDLTRTDGAPWVAWEGRTPTLFVTGARDRLVSVDDVRATCARLPSCDLEVLPGYGHVDPLLGVRSRDEVTPRILRWLAERS
ncbi:MAG: alpha/beta fold hydrolase [Alphaproteobacteria bacterium]|nr:alpha/beta fold hydrolase [Alphaproteobacteria bacterium]